ncbi:hypothetical protein SteCoe_6426 [Stentor coeruleus]|uniref:C2CD3 N-terminal C2 domain-containing protein n=1 Tax=Stentor coeruleus TaxID=5963 RepID=A0A1R2CPY6_9CILI|nr:hypothetical protein SteCoe_6426 [Stentor coeruleus]
MSETSLSLPPEIKGKIHGKLCVEIGEFVWVDSSLNQSVLHFRLKFWGEKGPGVILKAKNFRTEAISNRIEYTIKCTQPIFINYLMDMGFIILEVTDNSWRLLGSIKINVKLYLKRDNIVSKGNLASNFGFSNVDVQGIFPILASSEPPKKLGEVELSILSGFGEVVGKISREVATELLPNPVVVKENIIKPAPAPERNINPDDRIPNSLLKPSFGEYNMNKLVSFQEEYKETFKPAKATLEEKSHSDVRELPKEDSNLTVEWENLQKKGERLRKKIEASSKPDIFADFVPAAQTENDPLPTISELKALSFPEDLSEKPKIDIPDRPISELNSITHLKLTISSLTLIILRKDLCPFIECTIPLPGIEGNRTDSFKISHKSSNNDIYNYNHESLHHVVVTDGVFSKLASSTIKFKILANDKGKIIEIGKVDLIWEKILLAKGFYLPIELDVTQEEARAKRTTQKIVAKLNLTCSLINDKKPQNDIKSNEIQKPIETPKSYLLYLYIDHVTKLKIPSVNLFITYKTFPEPERISTEIFWNYKDSWPIGHRMVTAVLVSDSIISKLSTTSLIIEIWNKPLNLNEELLGIVKLPLQLYSSYMSTGDSLANSVYPLIAFDEYKPINNIKSNEEIGYLKVCLAMGSPLQVNKLRQVHETTPKVIIQEAPPQDEVSQEKPEFVERSIQISERPEKDDVLAQSVESIGDIAAFLNQKNKGTEVDVPEEFKETTPEKNIEKPEVFLQSLDFKPIEIKSTELVQQKAPVKSIEEIIEYFKKMLSEEKISLEEELKIVDRFNYGYLHRENLTHLLHELRLGLTLTDINTFIDYILENKKTSNVRRVLFNDILATLDLIEPLFIRHAFTVTIVQIFSCPIMSKIQGSSIFVKYLFPSESSFIETDLLEPGNIVPINLKSLHSCTFPLNAGLSECFPEKLEGISIYLCKYTNNSEEKVIGKGILPIEELCELESCSKLNRVICLYGDHSEMLGIVKSDLIGKIRIQIEYSKDYSYQNISASSELLFEKHTQVDRKIPRHNVLSVTLEGFTELNRGMKYLQSSGFLLSNKSKLHFSFAIFHEDAELNKEQPLMVLASTAVKEKESIQSSKQIEITLEPKILEYLHQRSAALFVHFDQELLGQCKIPLLQLLLHSSVKGDYAILNEYGQFMGLASMSLSLNADHVVSKYTPPPEPVKPSKTRYEPELESPRISKAQVEKCSVTEKQYEEKIWSYGQLLESAEDDDIKAKFYDNMRAIENLSKNLELKLSGSYKTTSPLRSSYKNPDFSRFVPIDTYSDNPHYKTSHPLRKSRETSPQKETFTYSLPQSYEAPLKKSRETSPVVRFSNDIIEHKRIQSSPERQSGSFPRSSIENPSKLQEYNWENKKNYENLNRKPLQNYEFEEKPFTQKDVQERFIEPNRKIENLYENKFINPYKDIPENPITKPKISNAYETPSLYEIQNYKQSFEEPKKIPQVYEKEDVPFPGSSNIVNPYIYKENISDYEAEQDDDWNPDRIADMLKTIEEAARYGENEESKDYKEIPDEPYENIYKFPESQYGNYGKYSNKGQEFGKNNEKLQEAYEPLGENYEENNQVWKSSKITEDIGENFNKNRFSPKISKSSLPKSLLSDPEISRIAAIMKGSK